MKPDTKRKKELKSLFERLSVNGSVSNVLGSSETFISVEELYQMILERLVLEQFI